MTWFALQHKPSQGDRAVLNLQNQQVSCFFPKIEVEKIRSGKRRKQLEPLFPGYIFINLGSDDAAWSKLRSTYGVSRVVSFAGKPAPLDDAVIDQIRACVDRVAHEGGIKSGQPVQLDEGPFKGFNAIFQTYDGEERALVLITFMQKQQQVRVPLSSLRA